MSFSPTHRIEYLEHGKVVHSWDVAIQDDKSTLDAEGKSEWTLIDGKPKYYGGLPLKKWPDADAGTKVTNLNKRPKCKAGHEVKHMPDGTIMHIAFRNGRWEGKCEAAGITVEADATSVMGITSKLCKLWFRERYV